MRQKEWVNWIYVSHSQLNLFLVVSCGPVWKWINRGESEKRAHLRCITWSSSRRGASFSESESTSFWALVDSKRPAQSRAGEFPRHAGERLQEESLRVGAGRRKEPMFLLTWWAMFPDLVNQAAIPNEKGDKPKTYLYTQEEEKTGRWYAMKDGTK